MMKNNYQCHCSVRLLQSLVFVAALFCLPLSVQSQTDLPPAESLLSNAPIGTEFWLAIPPSEGWGSLQSLLEIYVTSTEDTEVRLELPRTGQARTLEVKANKVTKFSSKDNTANWAWEVRTSEQVQDLGIRLTSDEPIAVQAVTAKTQASDGFSVLPVQLLGTEYRHMSYYDSKIGFSFGRAGGFLVVASEDNTSVSIKLEGRGNGQTVGGKKVGDRWSVNLMEGQVYMVRGSAEEPSGAFDISGSHITSSKPVALVSFHQQAIVPAPAQFVMGTLSEMMPPVKSWGRNHISLEYQGSQQGTYYRLMATEPNTAFSLKSYDQNTGQQIASKSGVLVNPGDMAEYEEVNPQQSPGAFIQGIAVWEADKPVLLMQYSFGASWGAGRPFMTLVPPVQQRVNHALFQVPDDASGTFLHLFAIGEPEDPENKLLKSYEINGEPLLNRYPRFVTNNIANTNIYWAAVPLQGGVFELTGDARFSGYVYGNISFGGYGYPIGLAGNRIFDLDTLQPEVQAVEECGTYTLTVTENRNGAKDDEPRQVDQGIAKIVLLDEFSSNVKMILLTDTEIRSQYEINTFEVSIEQQNKLLDGVAVYAILDRAGNVSVDSLRIPALTEIVELSNFDLRFDAVRVGDTREVKVQLVNPSESDLTIESLNLKANNVYQLVDPPAVPFEIQSGSSIELTLVYAPAAEDVNGDAPDIDTLIAATDCNEFILAEVSGRGVLPHIQVVDWDAGKIEINKEVCNEEGIAITNTGTGDLTVTGMTGVNAPFDVSNVVPAIPFSITPGETVQLRNMCFAPTEKGSFEVQVVFTSNSDDTPEQHTSVWIGEGDSSSVINSVGNPDLEGYSLSQGIPNPARDKVQIAFALGKPGQTRIEISDALGNVVAVPLDEFMDTGEHQLTFNTANLASGTYYYRIHSGEYTATETLIVLR